MVNNMPSSQRGATVVHWLIALAVLAGVGAFSVDLNDLHTAHIELQKAADAGALAGAQYLYCPDGTLNYTGRAPQCTDSSGTAIPFPLSIARSEAQRNYSQGAPVTASAQYGHWTFKTPSDTSSVDSRGVKRGGTFNDDSNNQATSPLLFPTAPAPPSPYAACNFRPVVDRTHLSDPSASQCNNNANCGVPGANSCTSGGVCADYVGTDLNRDPCNINAVKVCVQNSKPVLSFFGKLLGLGPLSSAACAVAYVGFSGSIPPGEGGVDIPIGICVESIIDSGGGYNCTQGQYQPSTTQNLKWTDLTNVSGNQCSVSSNTEKTKVFSTGACVAAGQGNGLPLYTQTLILGELLNDTNGTQDTALQKLIGCWQNDPDVYSNGTVNTSVGPNKPLYVKMPLITCNGYNPGSCNPLIGALGVQILWMVDQASKMAQAGNVPTTMTGVSGFSDWPQPPGTTFPDPYSAWTSFVQHFNLPASAQCNPGATKFNDCPGYQDKTIYFVPNCSPIQLGGTGGGNFGDRALVPVLVD